MMRFLLLVLVLVLLSVRCSAAERRFRLDVWSTRPTRSGVSRCAECDAFWRDWHSDAEFRAAIQARFDVRFRDVDREWLARMAAGVVRWPAFQGAGWRVVRYQGPDWLLDRLGLRRPEPVPHGTVPRVPAVEPVAGASEPVPRSQSWEEILAARIEGMKLDAERARHQAAERQRELAERLAAATERAEKLAAEVAAARAAAGPVTDLTGGDLPQQGGPRPKLPADRPAVAEWSMAGVRRWIQRRALAVGGPAALGATWLVFWLMRRRRRRSATDAAGGAGAGMAAESQSAGGACVNCGALLERLRTAETRAAAAAERSQAELAELAGQLERATQDGVRTQTRYVRVPTADREAEALREAMRRVAELHPQVVWALNLVDGAAEQIRDGWRVAAADGKPAESRPGMWNDQSPAAAGTG